MGVQVIAGQGWPHEEEGKDLEGGQKASKGLKPADLELHSISNGEAMEGIRAGHGELNLRPLNAHPPHPRMQRLLGQARSPHGLGSCPGPGCALC